MILPAHRCSAHRLRCDLLITFPVQENITDFSVLALIRWTGKASKFIPDYQFSKTLFTEKPKTV